jgi:acetyl esterase/lipase
MRLLHKLLISIMFAWMMTCSLQAQRPDSILYKQVDSVSLCLHIDYPLGYHPSLSYPAMVFFFGGGWNGGTTGQFEPQAEYFASRGMVCFRADYRVKSRHGTTPFESLKDAKSAMRYP